MSNATLRPAPSFRNPDPFASPRRQIALAVTAVLATLLSAIFSPNPLPLEFKILQVPFIVLGLLIATTSPAVFTVIYLFLVSFKIHDISVLEPVNYLIAIASRLLVFALFWHFLLAGTARLQLRGPPIYLALLWLLLTFGVVTAQWQALAMEAWIDYSKLLLLAFAVLVFIQTERHVRLFSNMLLAGGVVVALAAVANFWLENNLIEGSRAVAGERGLGNPNDVAFILLIPLALAMTKLITLKTLNDRLPAALATAAIGYAIVLTQSRGGLLAVVALLGVIANNYFKSKVLLVSFLAILAAALYVAMGIYARPAEGVATFQDPSAMSRIYAWLAAINMAIALPLTGVGIGNFASEFGNYTAVQWPGAITAHSIWFLILGEAGIPGFILFVTLVVSCIRACIRNVHKLEEGNASASLQMIALATYAGLVGFLVGGSFMNYVYQWPLYILIVLTTALTRLADKAPPNSEAPPGGT